MDSLDAITIKAFLSALIRLDAPLPTDLQNQLNKISKSFPSDSKLHALAKSYPPLAQEYTDARLVQKDGERFRLAVAEPDCSAQVGDEQIHNFVVEVLKAEDSVDLVKKHARGSDVLGQLLFRLQRQTSFMVKDERSIPEEELWLWQNPKAWASLESGLRQATAGKGRFLGDFTQYKDLEIDD